MAVTNTLIQDTSTGRNIVTVAEVQSYINNTNTGLTSFLQSCISYVSATFENYTQTGLKVNDYTGYYPVPINNSGYYPYTVYNSKIYTNNIPIISVSSVQFRISPSESYSDYSSDLSKSIIVSDNYVQLYNLNYYPVNFADPQAFKINYIAGFSDCPYDLKKIAIEAVTEIYQESYEGGKTRLGLKTMNNSSIEGNSNFTYYKLSTQHQDILDNYKKVIC